MIFVSASACAIGPRSRRGWSRLTNFLASSISSNVYRTGCFLARGILCDKGCSGIQGEIWQTTTTLFVECLFAIIILLY